MSLVSLPSSNGWTIPLRIWIRNTNRLNSGSRIPTLSLHCCSWYFVNKSSANLRKKGHLRRKIFSKLTWSNTSVTFAYFMLLHRWERKTKYGNIITYIQSWVEDQSLFGGTINGSVVDSIDDVMGSHAIHCAAHRLGRSKNLLHHTCKYQFSLYEGSGPGGYGSGSVIICTTNKKIR